MTTADTTETVEFQSTAKRALAAEAPALRDRIAVETAKAEAIAAQRTAAQIKDALDAVGVRVPAGTKVAELRDAWVDRSVQVLPEFTRLRDLEWAVGEQKRVLRRMREAAEAADKVAAEFAADVAAANNAMQTANVAARHSRDLARVALNQSAYARLVDHLGGGSDMEDAVRAVVGSVLADALGVGLSEGSYYGADEKVRKQATRYIVQTLVRALPGAEHGALTFI